MHEVYNIQAFFAYRYSVNKILYFYYGDMECSWKMNDNWGMSWVADETINA